jgi:hypothetical protein
MMVFGQSLFLLFQTDFTGMAYGLSLLNGSEALGERIDISQK